MAFKHQEMTLLIAVATESSDKEARAAAKEKARNNLIEAYEEALASLDDAAGVLGCSKRTIRRWVDKLDLRVKLQKIKERAVREGWHHDKNRRGGRKPKAA